MKRSTYVRESLVLASFHCLVFVNFVCFVLESCLNENNFDEIFIWAKDTFLALVLYYVLFGLSAVVYLNK